MPFRQRQKYRCGRFVPVLQQEDKTLESGLLVAAQKNLCEAVMPDVELFDLQTQLDAGINLQEVNSAVLRPRSVNLDSYTKQPNKKEVENEN